MKFQDYFFSNFDLKLDQFITEEMVPTLIDDGFPSSHPIFKNITNPYEIDEYFDDIESSKAAAIVRWVENIVGTAQIDKAIIVSSITSSFLYTVC